MSTLGSDKAFYPNLRVAEMRSKGKNRQDLRCREGAFEHEEVTRRGNGKLGIHNLTVLGRTLNRFGLRSRETVSWA